MSDAYTAEREAREHQPRTFQLGGRTWEMRRGKVPMALIFNVADAMARSEGLDVLTSFESFLVAMVTKSQREEFRAFLHAVPDEDEDESAYDWQEMQEVTAELVARLTGAPFPSPSGSPSSPWPNGASSLAPSDSEASSSLPHRRAGL